MSNKNTIDKNNCSNKSNICRNLWYALILAGLLNINTPTYANSNNYKNDTTEQVKSDSNTINGIKLPSIYQDKIDYFLANNTIMEDSGTKEFTINFIEKEMEADRGISKENQLLFIRHAIYKQATDNDLYDGQDGNQKIAEDFNNKTVSIRIRACGQKYRNGALKYMNQRSADAQQRSADAQQRSANAQQRSSNALNSALENIIRFYNRYKKDPNTIKDDEVKQRKEKGRQVVQGCKDDEIDYRAKLSPEMLKFYGVE